MRGYLMHQQDPTSYLIKGYVMSIAYTDRIPFSWQSFWNFCVSRCSRIVPVAWLTVFIFFGIHAGIQMAGMKINHPLILSPINIVANLLFLDSNIPGIESASAKWSVSNEMAAYLTIFPLSFALKKTPVLIIVLIAVPAIQVIGWHQLASMGTLFSRCLPEFLCGCALYYLNKKIKLKANLVFFLVGLAAIVWAPDNWQAIAAMIVVWSAVSEKTICGRFLSTRVFEWLGDISYSLYLLHGLVILAIAGLLKHFPHLRDSYGIWIIVPIAVALAIGHISYTYYENPMREFFRHRLLKPL